MTITPTPHRSRTRWTLALVFIGGALACLLAVFKIGAANPTSGTMTLNSPPLAWDGTGAGGVSPTGEMTCVDGVSCDTFTITVSGTPTDWLGKKIAVVISWVVLASDYDVYVHKNSNAGPTIGSSTGATNTSETVDIDPGDLDADGSSVFTVHVVYSSAVAGDQYHGTATVLSTGPAATPTPTPPPKSTDWKITYHGECCEGNLAAAGNNTHVLLPVLVQGNKIKKSSDGGQNWVRKYPPVDASVPYGIEGDLVAFGNDVVFFGTELGDVISAYSRDGGESYMISQTPIASAGNDQAWAYLGPLENMRPGGALPGDRPYVMSGWMRIGTALVFSFDGGVTYPIQTPLVGNNGSGPEHVVCQQNAHPPLATAPADTRVANPNFRYHKGGRHGTWGTDRKFYWSEVTPDSLYVCNTEDFGATWNGVKHPLGAYNGSNFVVSHSAFDNRGTLYVLHGDKLRVSFNGGESFAFTHTMPRYGNALRSDSGSDQYFAVNCGTAHVAVLEDAGEGRGRVYYMRGIGVDTANPSWTVELVDEMDNVRLDFLYLVVDGNGIPTISYTTPEPAGTVREVTTASRNAPMPGDVICANIVSRKTHSSVGTFDVRLPLGVAPGIECRTGGATNDYQLMATFESPVVNMGPPTVSSGSGTVTNWSANGSTITVNLTGVTSPQVLTIKLSNVTTNIPLGDVFVPMGVVVGDTNADGTVNSGDAQQTRSRSGQLADPNNFRSDVNTDGAINSGDAIIVRSRSGQGIINP